MFDQYRNLTIGSTFNQVEGGQFVCFKPGFTRLSFSYFISHQEMEFIFRAIEWVSTNAHKMLGKYDYSIKTGSWKYCGEEFPLKSNISFLDGSLLTQNQLFEFADAIVNKEISRKKLFSGEDELKQSAHNCEKREK